MKNDLFSRVKKLPDRYPDVQQLTRDQSIAFAKSDIWVSWTMAQRASWQIRQTYLCFPNFGFFHEAVEKVLDCPVHTLEFAFAYETNGLADRLERLNLTAPSVQEVVALLDRSG